MLTTLTSYFQLLVLQLVDDLIDTGGYTGSDDTEGTPAVGEPNDLFVAVTLYCRLIFVCAGYQAAGGHATTSSRRSGGLASGCDLRELFQFDLIGNTHVLERCNLRRGGRGYYYQGSESLSRHVE